MRTNSKNTISWWRTTLGDAEADRLRSSIDKEFISQGPVTEEFEKSMAQALDIPYAVATTSGSVALLMALMALGIGRDDEVIVPNRTFVATAHAALLLGARVVLADVDPYLPLVDVQQIISKITTKTKAIIPVHLNGRSADMEAIMEVAKEYRLSVIEDACQSLFSKNQKGYLGTQSDAGCFSFGMTKLLAAGQGGMIVTHREELYHKLKMVRNHGVPDTFAASYTQLGLNFKFTDLLASIGLVQLDRSGSRISHLERIYSLYNAAVLQMESPLFKTIPVKVADGEVPLYAEVLCQRRDEFQHFLSEQGIQSRPFLPDLDQSPHLNNDDTFPNSREYSAHGVFLPCGPEQPLENVNRVTEAMREFTARIEGNNDWSF